MRRPLYTTVDDVLLTGREWLTDAPPRAAVVLVHGFSASTEDPNVCAVAGSLYDDGIDVVAYDARGHGGSGGASTLGDLERHDVAAAVDVARERTDRVVLVGASMGAIAVLRYAADDGASELTGVVTVSCPSQWKLPRNARGVFAAALTRTPMGRAVAARWMRVQVAPRWTNPEAPIALVPRIKVPLAFVHGADDRFVPASAARDLHAAAHEPRRLDVVDRMGHAFEPASVPVIRTAVDWALDHSDGG